MRIDRWIKNNVGKLPQSLILSGERGLGKSNFIYQEDAAKIVLKILNRKGIVNVGGPSQTIYKFARNDNKKIKKIFSKGEFPKRTDMKLEKLKKMIRI